MRNRSWQYRAVPRQTVKYSAVFPLGIRGWSVLVVVGALVCVQVVPAWAQRLTRPRQEERSLLLGGGHQPVQAPVIIDPVLPRGEIRGFAQPHFMKSRRCSLRRPVCVIGQEAEPLRLKATLGLLEQAFEEHRWGADLPGPESSFQRPLIWDLAGAEGLSVEVSARPTRGFDRGEAWCSGGIATLDQARRCVSAVAVASLAPATASWIRDGYAAEWSRRLGPAGAVLAAIESSTRRPQVGVLTSSSASVDWRTDHRSQVSLLRSARFFSYLEERSLDGTGSAGFLALGLAATRTAPGSLRWESEPDLMDVLLATVRSDRTHLARLFDDFANFSFFQSQDWGVAIDPDWTISASSLPRSVAFLYPVEPTGSLFLKLELSDQDRESTFAFRISCEAPVSYVWSVTRLNAAGQQSSRVPIAYRQRGSEAHASIAPEPDTQALLLVGTNMGGITLSHPFDPDHGPHEAHGCTAAVNRLSSAESPKAADSTSTKSH